MRPSLQALVAVTGFVGQASAQAYFGTVDAQLDACGSPENFIELGCFPDFTTVAEPDFFPFRPTGYIANNPSRSFPGWDPGSLIDNTQTSLDCARVCRGFGYRYSAQRNNNCNCGNQLPAEYETPLPDDSSCNVECTGDAGQTCGGGSSATIFVDPTFADPASVPRVARNEEVAEFYEYLGCYFLNNFPTQDALSAVLLPTIDDCFEYCAGLAYPLVFGFPAA